MCIINIYILSFLPGKSKTAIHRHSILKAEMGMRYSSIWQLPIYYTKVYDRLQHEQHQIRISHISRLSLEPRKSGQQIWYLLKYTSHYKLLITKPMPAFTNFLIKIQHDYQLLKINKGNLCNSFRQTLHYDVPTRHKSYHNNK